MENSIVLYVRLVRVIVRVACLPVRTALSLALSLLRCMKMCHFDSTFILPASPLPSVTVG